MFGESVVYECACLLLTICMAVLSDDSGSAMCEDYFIDGW